ncbi:MAG: AAA family ATPase, partial [Acidobacteria bacterium]|nr:AAA family ATPase [Acidobacteriota bacterium]
VRYLMAAEQVKTKSKQLNLTDEQRSQLREVEATRHAEAESAFLKLYKEVWLPRAEEGGLGIERVVPGGRILQTTLNEKKKAMIHERIMELITSLQRKVFGTLNAVKIVEFFKLGEGQPPALGLRTSEVVDGFYSFLGFTRLTKSVVIQKAVADGANKGVFGYTAGSIPTLGSDGRYQLPLDKIRFGPPQVSDDEIDLDSGFLIMPPAIPQAAPGPGPTPPGPTPPGPGPGPEPLPPESVPPGPVAQTSVELAFRADRNQLYTAWQAIANLADLAGSVAVTVRADSEKGFDQSKLRNGVLEPLEEADLIKSQK